MSLYAVVDLALRNSPEVHMAEADILRTQAALSEQREAYKPNLLIGSNIGYSYGFPIGQPSIANVQSNSLVLSFSQPDYVRSARAAHQAALSAMKDTREKVALEASLAYAELSTDTEELAVLQVQHTLGEQLIEIEEDRVAAGVDGRMEETKARLTSAQLELRQIQLQGHADVLAARIANLSGLPLEGIAAEPSSIPEGPSLLPLPAGTPATQQSAGLQAAYATAQSKRFVAFGDDRAVSRPTLGLGINYSRFAEFNNYQSYYRNFQHNNFGAGINISIPIFDDARRAHARGSAAEATHAFAEADQMRNRESEQKLELSLNLKTLAAQRHVAELQQQLAQDQLDAVLIEQQQGTGHPGATPVTPRDEVLARIQKQRFTVDLLDAKFQLLQAQLSLLRANDELVAWAMQTPKP